jgi:hypothetical protein
VHIDSREQKCIQVLAELFGEGKTLLASDALQLLREKGCDLDEKTFPTVLSLLESYGAIGNVTHYAGGLVTFHISPEAVQLSREIDAACKKAQEPGDIVDQFKQTVRSNRIVAWLLIAFFVFVGLVTAVNQLLDVFKKLNWFQ